jgi:hypothetical protein
VLLFLIDFELIFFLKRLGLIAMVDCTGRVTIWNYELCYVEACIPNCISAETCQLTFIDPLPYLVVVSDTQYVIVLVGVATEAIGRKCWRLNTVVSREKPKPIKRKNSILAELSKRNEQMSELREGREDSDEMTSDDESIRKQSKQTRKRSTITSEMKRKSISHGRQSSATHHGPFSGVNSCELMQLFG